MFVSGFWCGLCDVSHASISAGVTPEVRDKDFFVSGFLKLNRSPEMEELIFSHEREFKLLTIIAWRARRVASLDGSLQSRECYIGDLKRMGMSEQSYRTAKQNLEKWGISTFKSTNKGTIAKLVDSRYYDINTDPGNDQSNERVTSDQRAGNERVTTNKKDKKEKKDKNEKKEVLANSDLDAQADKRKLLIEAFCNAYESEFGSKYCFQGGRDGKAVGELLKRGTASEIIETAKAGWKLALPFIRTNSQTLHGLCHIWNSLVAELARALTGKTKEPNQIQEIIEVRSIR